MNKRPAEDEYQSYYVRYISLVPETEILPVLHRQIEELQQLASGISSERETFRYAPGKWTIREVFGHLVDYERVFAYRAFCISKGDQASFPSFEQDDYIYNAHYNQRPLADIMDELLLLRKSNLAFLSLLTDDDWNRRGTVNNHSISVLALGYMMAGHIRHHVNVLKQNYGV
ncbi:MAG TPA: DinB family protein [Bacteroidota bacterium]|nr:DinB family protein [Bacteroidota bacterium]